MRNKFFIILIGICVLSLAFSGSVFAKERVIFGGGPAGAWAAITAREAGAEVVLADKGFFGTSGASHRQQRLKLPAE